VSLIYGLSGIFILPFEGIFRKGYAQGLETTSVLEPSVLVAIIVYAILAWGIVTRDEPKPIFKCSCPTWVGR